jgi:hypothetical protein
MTAEGEASYIMINKPEQGIERDLIYYAISSEKGSDRKI